MSVGDTTSGAARPPLFRTGHRLVIPPKAPSDDLTTTAGPDSQGTQVAVKGGLTPEFTEPNSARVGVRVSFCNNSAAYNSQAEEVHRAPWSKYTGVFFFVMNPSEYRGGGQGTVEQVHRDVLLCHEP